MGASAMKYEEREAMKVTAYRMYEESGNVAGRACALEMVIRAHYDRSREFYGAGHPCLHTYACHWVIAQDVSPDDSDASMVLESLRQKYKEPSRPHMTKGSSYWGS